MKKYRLRWGINISQGDNVWMLKSFRVKILSKVGYKHLIMLECLRGTYISQGDNVGVFPKPQQNLNFFMWILLLFVHDL